MNVFPFVFCALKIQHSQCHGCRLLINMLKSVKKKKKKKEKRKKEINPKSIQEMAGRNGNLCTDET